MKAWTRLAAVVTGILLLVAVAAVWIAQSDWLRAKVHNGIIEQAEKATGGKVELGAFRFDWRTLTAEVDRFVIHGTESASDAPLLAIDRITVGLRVISLIGRDVNVSRVEAEHPQAHVVLYPDGRTNLPQPRTRRTGKPIAETILDLKIGKFDLRDGTFFAESPGQPPRRMPWEAHGNNLAAQMSYDPANRRYSGNLSLAPLRVESVDFDVAASAAMEPKRITISNATVRTRESQVDLKDVVIDNFADPVANGRYEARVSLDETASIFQLRTRQSGTVYVSGSARYRTPGEYAVDGALHGADITYWKLRDMRVVSDVHATPGKIHLSSLHVQALGGEVLADADVVDFRHVTARGRAERFDLRKTAAIETKKPLPYDGMVSGPFDATIDANRIRVSARLNVAPAPNGPAARGEVAVRYDSGRKTVELGQSWVELPNSRIEASGTLGERLNVKADSRDFSDLLPAVDALIPGKPVALSFASASF
ncbi:MAG TPA: hypothetical protein VHB50_04245, partial [Bryobacteraceae bacterium]|nr:hypothetical protein [Bryobacteraceae bacterium]